MTDQKAQQYADLLGVTLKEFQAAYYQKLSQVNYEDAMNRSAEEIVMAIFDSMGIRLDMPLSEY